MNAQHFESILSELIDENPFAVRAVLKIVAIRYTDEVPSLAVTCRERPELLVNLSFVAEHCHTDEHVKAVICHEFLHVLLRHTDRLEPITPAEHLATDAVINAIIHRTLGPEYSDMMARLYARERRPHYLLRPPTPRDTSRSLSASYFHRLWCDLYAGKLVVDDIRELAEDAFLRTRRPQPEAGYLGNHDHRSSGPIDGELEEALEGALKCFNGNGVWRNPAACGLAADSYVSVVSAGSEEVDRWRRATYAVLRKHLSPDPRSPKELEPSAESPLPVLSPHDRRGFMRAFWSPLMPDALWPQSRRTPIGTAQIYLDVSGSMYAEMSLIVKLLAQLSSHIRRPFWAFSDSVAPARIRNGQLVAETSGGTSMSCVLEHLIETRPSRAVVITDGYIERLDRKLVRRAAGTRIHAIVTRDGSPREIHEAGIAHTQLGRLPK